YKEKFPNIDITVLGLRSDEIKKQLIKGEIDLGIFIGEDKLYNGDEYLESIPLYPEIFALAVPNTHELAYKESVSLNALRHTANILFPKNYFMRRLLDRRC